MISRSLLVAVLATGLALSYAGPAVCASMHASGAVPEQVPEHAHHGAPADDASSALPDPSSCLDLMQCGLTLVGPALEVAQVPIDHAASWRRPDLAATRGPERAWSPPLPPPRA
jgi:hypothetical protein